MTIPSAPAPARSRAVRFAATEVAADGRFEGYGSVFGVVNSYNEIVLPGAFAATIAAHRAAGTRPKGLWQHDTSQPILVWEDLSEDDIGLRCKGRLILDVERAREAHALMKAGAIDGLSIGFDEPDEDHCDADAVQERYGIVPDGAANHAGKYVCVRSLNLWEISVVTFPSCQPATVDLVRHRPRLVPAPALPSADLARLVAALGTRNRLLRRSRPF